MRDLARAVICHAGFTLTNKMFFEGSANMKIVGEPCFVDRFWYFAYSYGSLTHPTSFAGPFPLLSQGKGPWILWNEVNKLTSVFHASVLLLIMNFVITLSKLMEPHGMNRPDES